MYKLPYKSRIPILSWCIILINKPFYMKTQHQHFTKPQVQNKRSQYSTWNSQKTPPISPSHYGDVIIGAIASQITNLTIFYSTVYPDADQRKHQSSASMAFVWGIHRGPVNSPHKWPVTRKMFPFDDIIMMGEQRGVYCDKNWEKRSCYNGSALYQQQWWHDGNTPLKAVVQVVPEFLTLINIDNNQNIGKVIRDGI